MRFYLGALLSTLSLPLSFGQGDAPTAPQSNDPVVAAQQAQQQAQFAYENQIADLNSAANQSKEGLLTRRNALTREIQNCFMQKNEAGIQAEQEAEQAKQQAMNQLIQGAQQGLTPLLQNANTANNMGKDEAVRMRKDAIAAQHKVAQHYETSCRGVTGATGDPRIDKDARNASSIIAEADIVERTEIPAAPAAGAVHAPGAMTAACKSAAQSLIRATQNAQRDIKDAKEAESAAGSNKMAWVMTAVSLGANVYGYNQATSGAEAGLENANRLNGMNYDSCKQGVLDEAAEIDRQLANIDKQLAEDKARLAKQFAQFKLNIPSNIQSKSLLPSADDGEGLPNLGTAGSAVVGTKFSPPGNPFANLGNKGGAGSGGSGGAAAGGGGAGAGGGSGNVGWGFRDPYETNNPGLAYTLPNQPEKANLIGGVDGDLGSGGGGGAAPGLEGFKGFEDPFGNLKNDMALAAAGGNGFFELAIKTRRRVYAHLPELLGNGPQISAPKKENSPERKISSIKD